MDHEYWVWEVMERLQGEIAQEVRALLGEPPYDQGLFDTEQRARRIIALKSAAAVTLPEAAAHSLFCAAHEQGGWTYGPEFDPATKQHPNLKPWDELPANTRAKIRIFNRVAAAAGRLVAEIRGAGEESTTSPG